ncbi:PTS sugar transporter subunit IIA, partial [Streptococcus suis]
MLWGFTAENWQEAVHKAVEPLSESGAATEEYYDPIIASTEEYGPYYVHKPGMAMPHAQARVGV